MSTFAQDSRPFTRGYGKSTGGPQYRAGDRYGNRRNFGGSTNRRGSNPPSTLEHVSPTTPTTTTTTTPPPPPPQYDISAGPPSWLDTYLENFKKNLISEITDDIMKALDNSYKNDTDKRRFKSCYFALKKRLTYFESQKAAAGDTEQHKTSQQQPTSSDVTNEENKHDGKKPHEKFSRPRNGRNGTYKKRFNESISSSLNGANDSSLSSTSRVSNGHQKHVDEEPTVEAVEEKIPHSTKITEETSEPIIIINDYGDIIDDKVESIVKEEFDHLDRSSNEMAVSKEISNSVAMTEESTKPLKQIFKLLDNNMSDEQISSATDQSPIEDVKMDKTLRMKVLNLLNKLTCENIEILGKQVKELEMETLEKQQEVVNVFVERAIAEPLYSVVYAQMCKKMAVEHECVAAFCEMLIARCHAELTRHEEQEKIRLMRMKEAFKCNDEEIKVEFDQKKSYEFMGALLFMGELYNQELLTDIVVEKYLQCLLRNGTEIELEYLCHLLCLIGKKFELRGKSVAPYMDHLVELRDTAEIRVNLTMLINSVAELMANNWEPLIPDASSETTDFEDAAGE